jgi:hypothetical protein
LIVTGQDDFGNPLVRATAVIPATTTTNGDVIIAATSIFIAMYLHELLCLSSPVSKVSVMHHLGACLVAAIMVTRNVRWEVESSTAAYTVLIMTYGTFFVVLICVSRLLIMLPGIFDLLAGLWPRPCMVARTIWPEKHRLNMIICYAACALTLLGSVDETIVAMNLFGINHKAWSLAIRIVTPINHAVFMGTRLTSSWIVWSLDRKAERQLRQPRDEEKNATSSPASETTLLGYRA